MTCCNTYSGPRWRFHFSNIMTSKKRSLLSSGLQKRLCSEQQISLGLLTSTTHYLCLLLTYFLGLVSGAFQ